MIEEVESVYKRAIETIEGSTAPPDPDAPNSFKWRLRPSEEAAIACNRYLNPPEPWGIKLCCSSTFWGPEKCVNIGRMLILNHTVTSLDLSMCDMQEEGAVRFFSCIKRNRCLKHLNVNGNYIGDRGAVAASKCIGNLESLHASCNGIHDAGAVALASSLPSSSKIKTLNLRGNRLTFLGAYKLVSALEHVVDLLSPELRDAVSAGTTLYTGSEKGLESSLKEFTSAKSESSEKERQSSFGHIMEGLQESESDVKEFNTSLHTLWLRQNDDIPEELFRVLDKILEKRVPQPPKGVMKKGRNSRKKNAS
ncbi:leucine-rich repeat protein (LRRP), putative [Trypanosoma equiperdum]|uniref:Leucine-rich repeat protein (LRRP) n=3 Tax=Trypanozoon TaxID=39700 RepID=Q57Y83_TRYB2|nr:hypothetical protein, conserved [Trypanosoma brucei gambiense DAL972]XP_845896.1 hypothetical protein, conserved [Trypanosoma brucei brucei TREU927]AAX69406.1 hypothetical protein, conserved [Trypanosoma brucei]SCU67439.1 leucine-rich repeat protein (LRRP), putative [Trypanosoma equiperdum]AAZ12337.1 hypothetical protein, conserved [Trypanosoma brucei brucei TREU927]CBH12364.1 hypothetical protein, conserved [Trypanosoma brucei gambiense DAL972]|eukprot:XP_011774645.1 hypothetical protein, conserved [Trypanosoma brucei gambiense DAL972]